MRHMLTKSCWVIYACYAHTLTRLTALCPGLPGWAGTRKVKPIWILLKQETVSGSGISWAICKYTSRFRQITMPAPHHSRFFTGRMPFLPPNQQRQSTEGKSTMLMLEYRLFKVFIAFLDILRIWLKMKSGIWLELDLVKCYYSVFYKV